MAKAVCVCVDGGLIGALFEKVERLESKKWKAALRLIKDKALGRIVFMDNLVV